VEVHEKLEGVKVLAVDDGVVRPVCSTSEDGSDRSKRREDRVSEALDDH
jgi:hypothetical protein